ncbi:MAG: AAA family ATPase [Planctomycetia bacterium]
MAKTVALTTRQSSLPAPATTLSSRLRELVQAAFSAIWITTHEPTEATRDLTSLCRTEGWRLGVWDCDRGMAFPLEPIQIPGVTDAQDPLAVIRSLPQVANGSGTTLVVFESLHRFLGATEIIQALARQVHAGKNNRCFVVVLAPVVQIPAELDKLFTVVDHELPGRAQLEEIARGVATQDGELPEGDELARVIEAAAGLTASEAENAFSLALVRHGKLEPETLWELKSQQLKKSGLVSLHRGEESFDQLGGLENLKAFCLRAMRRQSEGAVSNRPRGVLLLSPPGCGKSQFAKALGNETGRPTVVLDVGALLGSLVGQSESNVRAALKLADAMAPCVLFADEIEKALAGAPSSGQTDSGVTARVFGSLLTWLNDHDSDVFFVGTCNDASKLPPEFARAERFDGVFFVDLPGREQKDAIWAIYTRHYGLDTKQARPDDTNWTGAEIKSCCRLASLLDVPLVQASQNVVPVAVTAGDKIEGLRQWASGRCLSADRAGVYSRLEGASGGRVRRVVREPGLN